MLQHAEMFNKWDKSKWMVVYCKKHMENNCKQFEICNNGCGNISETLQCSVRKRIIVKA